MNSTKAMKAFVGVTAMAMATTAAANAVEQIPGEYIVGLKSNESLTSLLTIDGVKEVRNLKTSSPYAVVTLEDNTDSKSLVTLSSHPNVRFVEPNFVYRLIDFKSHGKISTLDPKFDLLWGLKNTGNSEPNRSGNPSGNEGVEGADIDAMRAWDITKGSKDIVVAVIDTGVDYNHPDLAGNMWMNSGEIAGNNIDDDGNGFVDDVYGYDFANHDANPIDGHNHGTHCAGTIAASHNDIGVAGVMADAKIMAVKFLSDSGSGSTAGAIEAIDYATKMNADIMSNSWGGGGFSQALEEAIQRASDAGIIFTAAAGNSSSDNDTRPHYPSNYQVPNVVSVAAHTAQDTLASFSSYGKRTVHIAAPGHMVLSTFKNGEYGVYSGTSMATPHVSGALGLLLAKEGRLDHEVMKERLLYTSVPVAAYKRKVMTGGRINAYNLLTDTRPERSEPNPADWVRVTLDTPWESEHPYASGASQVETYTQAGAKYIRVVIEKYDLESSYDFLQVTNPQSREVLEKISGAGENYASEYVEGESLELKFSSDASVTKWGFKVVAIEYQM